MRTLDQILEGVTAGGKWRRRPFGFEVQVDNGEEMAPVIMSAQNPSDAAYAARAACNFPALVRALDLMIYAPDSAEAMRVARNAMAEALRDS